MLRAADRQCIAFVEHFQKWKPTYLFELIESSHVESPGYYCDVCTDSCRPRNALRAHKHRGHSFIK